MTIIAESAEPARVVRRFTWRPRFALHRRQDLAAAVVERPWPPKNDPVEDEYLRLCHPASAAVTRAMVGKLPAEPDIIGRRPSIGLRPNRFDGSCRRARKQILSSSGRRLRDCWAGLRWVV